MHRDQIFLFFAVPLAAFGGLAALWLSFQVVEIAGAELITFAFAGMAVFMFIAALLLSVVAVSELSQSR